MQRLAPALMIVALGIAIEVHVAHAQSPDPRISEFIKAGKVRAAFGMNPTLAFRDTASGRLRGPALDLALALASRMTVELVPVEYSSPGAVLQGIENKAWDLTFLVIDPGRAGVVDFSPPYMPERFQLLGAGRFCATRNH